MKKVLCLILALILVLGVFVACDKTPQLTEHQKKQAALDGYSLAQSTGEQSSSFELPMTIGGYSVVWTSSNESSLSIVIGSTSYTAQPIPGSEVVTVKLTATIDTAVRTFNVTIAKKVVNNGDDGGGKGDNKDIADNTKYYNEITESLKLTKDYSGKSFMRDGIGEAVVDTNGYTDGDTTRFRLLTDNMTVIIRYYCIDTPESTGSVEKWGAAASKYNKEQLGKAVDIVLEATTTPPSHDSYGTRYLGYVWYRTSKDEDFKCLNLEMVENGFSANKALNTSDYPYYSKFAEAEDFAKSIELRIHSKLDDPLFTKDPVDMKIADFLDNPDLFYDAEHSVGRLVQFDAYVTDLKVSGTGTYTFVATQYDPETGKTASMNVYTMYGQNPASQFIQVGNYYRFVGNVQNYYGTWQLTSINYVAIPSLVGKTSTYLKQAGYYLMFNSNFDKTKWQTNWDANLYGDLTVKSVGEVEDGKLTFTAEAHRFTADSNGNVYLAEQASEFTFTVAVPQNYDNKIAVGSVLSLNGLQFVADSGELMIINYSGITFRQA